MPRIKKNKDVVENSIVKKIERIKAKKKELSLASNNGTANDSVVTSKKKKDKKKDTLKNKPKITNGADAKTDGKDEDPDTSGTLMLKDVIDLGGTQEDYDMLHNVSDNEKELVVDGGDSDFNVAELITFMKSNGMKTIKKSKAKGKPTVSTEESKEEIDKRVAPKICPVVPSNPPPHDRLIFKANEPW